MNSDIVRERLDEIFFQLAVGSPRSALRTIRRVREDHGTGWWTASLERAEAKAKARLPKRGGAR